MRLFETVERMVAEEETFALATVVSGQAIGKRALVRAGDVSGFGAGDESGSPAVDAGDGTGLPDAVIRDCRKQMETGEAVTRTYVIAGEQVDVFIQPFVPRPKIVIVGAVETAQALCRLGRRLGYRIVVTDARATFAAEERFPEADQVIKGWPQDVLPGIKFDENTYVVLLSHDPKFDEPTLQHVLPTAVRYVGAIGSRKTQATRRERLRAEGFGEQALAKLYGPVGLSLGGRSAEETALAIMAEITAVRYGKTGGMLSAG